jgi:hypothetical protein
MRKNANILKKMDNSGPKEEPQLVFLNFEDEFWWAVIFVNFLAINKMKT